MWLLVRHPLPRRPTALSPDRPAEIWRFDSRGRQLGRVVLPKLGGAESLVFLAQTRRQGASLLVR